MPDFRDTYRQAFETLGRTLGPRDETPEPELCAAETRLDLRAPDALRAYYQVAGRADDFNRAHERLLPPAEWDIDDSKLVFMAENQAVVLYGTLFGPDAGEDPPTFLAANGDEIHWAEVNARCSTFLLVLLYWQAAFGGAMPTSGTAAVPAHVSEQLERDWVFVGEVNGMRAYHRPGCAVCFLRWVDSWRVFGGAAGEAELAAVARGLNVRWDG